MTKLMAFDLDGTILFNRAVEPANERAIARWQAEGNLAVSCTGKSIFATQLALEPTAIRFDYHVLYTGAVITDREGVPGDLPSASSGECCAGVLRAFQHRGRRGPVRDHSG